MIRGMALRTCIALGALASAGVVRADDGAGPSAPLLSPGPLEVGFSSSWIFDEGRTYRTAWDDGATYGAQRSPRPVLVLEWYPAQAAPRGASPDAQAHDDRLRDGPLRDPVLHMPYGDYFSVAGGDPRLLSFADALRAHAFGIFVEQVMGVPEAALDATQRAELDELLAMPTPCRRDAAPAPGPFPLVVYHSGAGSSFEDNAALCEFLASHGYVVLASAFQKGDGSELGIDAGRGSAEDAQCLVRRARAQPFIDAGRVAFIGHSAGAQAFLKAASQAGCVADALVLLDTTQDYYALSMPLHEALVRETTDNVAQLTLPMLVAAGPEAQFALCDTFVHAERFYLTVPSLGHDEFISQGHQRLERIGRQAAAHDKAGDGGDAGGADEELARAPATHASYRALCETVLSFLDSQLGGDGADFAARLAADGARPWTHVEPRLAQVRRGVSGPAPWDPQSAAPPTPREFARLLTERGATSACEVLARFRDHEPRGPLYTSTMLAGSLLHELAAGGRMDEARLYGAALKDIPLDALGLFEFLADIGTLQGRPAQALHFLRLACELDPDNATLAARLRALESPQDP